jgi:hypothetical protein
MDLESLSNEFREYCKASKPVATPAEYAAASRLLVCLTQFLDERAIQCVREAGERPVLLSYQADATSFLCTFSLRARKEGGTTVRCGKNLVEMYTERGIVVVRNGDGKMKSSLLLKPPRLLAAGKTTWFLFDCANRFFPCVAALGHKGISLTHVCFDRAVLLPMARCLHERSRAFFEASTELGDDRLLIELSTWFVATGCGQHDGSNALKWAVMDLTEEQLLSDAGIVLRSLRNGYASLLAEVPSFVMRYLMFRELVLPERDVLEYWASVGIEADMVNAVASADMQWEQDGLYVSPAMRLMPDVVAHISDLFIYILKFRKPSLTRFLQQGPTSRGLMATLSIGLETLTSMARARHSDYYLHGISRLNEKMKLYFCNTGLLAYVSESVMKEMCEEPRLARSLDAMERAASDEVCYISNLSTFTWRRFAAVLNNGTSPTELQRGVLMRSHIVAGYLQKRVFSNLRDYPWRLVRGNVEDNVEALRRTDPVVADPGMTLKMQHLLKVGFSVKRLVAGASLLLEIIGDTLPSECGHGSIAVLQRMRPDLSSEQLCVRGGLHQARAFFTPTKEDATLAKLTAKRDLLIRKVWSERVLP